MRILFDHNVPAPLARHLHEHEVSLAIEMGWDRLANGQLLNAAENSGFEVFVTADKNMRYQQDFSGRVIAVIVLGNSSWPTVRNYIERVLAAIDASSSGAFIEVEIPLR